MDITSTVPFGLTNIEFHYRTSALEVINNGHTVQANVSLGSSITTDGKIYQLAQFHFHAPSEHEVNAESFAMEMHLVHVSASGELAVVGLLFRPGAASAALAPVWAVLPATTADTGAVASFDPNTLLPQSRLAHRYSGSLTTPPCSEGVSWMVLQATETASVDKVGEFSTIAGPNNRPVQPLNGREVLRDVN